MIKKRKVLDILGYVREGELGSGEKNFFIFYIYKMRVDTPGQGPHPSVLGNRLRLLRSAPCDKSRPYIYCLRFAYAHICLTSFLIKYISKALLYIYYRQGFASGLMWVKLHSSTKY